MEIEFIYLHSRLLLKLSRSVVLLDAEIHLLQDVVAYSLLTRTHARRPFRYARSWRLTSTVRVDFQSVG